MSRLIGADQPFGVSRKLSYQMSAERYAGRVLYVTFRSDTDLSKWLPAPLVMDDPHEGFLKFYELKRRPVSGAPYPPAFSQYNEACVTVLAAPPGGTARHYNIFMWVTHDWALYKARAALGWPKKLADIQMTTTFPSGGHYDRDAGTNEFAVDVSRYGYRIISVRAALDPEREAGEAKPFNGFYTVRHIPAPIGGDDIRELLVIEPKDGWFGTGTWGTAEVTFGDAPDEELSELGAITITSCVLRDTGWVLPGWPARRVMTLGALPAEIGETKPES